MPVSSRSSAEVEDSVDDPVTVVVASLPVGLSSVVVPGSARLPSMVVASEAVDAVELDVDDVVDVDSVDDSDVDSV